ncbi:uncharacterized protein LOC129869512 isoform X2 [Salvelinus fontinalis]|uniref:uncharacterized protein LOC129869512 isoform X2 n=1 Tax=Salvelinus fontinalis TaxID=8038 RepID=UPI002486A13D|nr:uncharacterized protein LOC129869512 isoform X2 [Salvelinus fontinalis]
MASSEVGLCKTRWKSLRDIFERHLRKAQPSGSGGTNQKEWKYMKILSFLIPYVQPRSSRGNLSLENAYSPQPQPMEPDDAEDDVVSLSPVLQMPEQQSKPTTGTAQDWQPRKRKQKVNYQDVDEELLAFVSQSLLLLPQRMRMRRLSLVPELKKTGRNKGRLKVQLLSLVVNWDDQHDDQQDDQHDDQHATPLLPQWLFDAMDIVHQWKVR